MNDFKTEVEKILYEIIADEDNGECNVSYFKENYILRLLSIHEQEQSKAIDEEKIKYKILERQSTEVAEWIAKRLIEDPELIKTIPSILWSYYQTWLFFCQRGFYSKLYEEMKEKGLIK